MALGKDDRCRVCGSAAGCCERGTGEHAGAFWCSCGGDTGGDLPGLLSIGRGVYVLGAAAADVGLARLVEPSGEDVARRTPLLGGRRVPEARLARAGLGAANTGRDGGSIPEEALDFLQGFRIDAADLPGGQLPEDVGWAPALERWTLTEDGWEQLAPGPALVFGLSDDAGKLVAVQTLHTEGGQDARPWSQLGGACLKIGERAPSGVLVLTHGVLDGLAIAAAMRGKWAVWAAVSLRACLRIPLPPKRADIETVVGAVRYGDGEGGEFERDQQLAHGALRRLADKHPRRQVTSVEAPPLSYTIGGAPAGSFVAPWSAFLAARGPEALEEYLLRDGPGKDFPPSEGVKEEDPDVADLDHEEGGLAFVEELCDEKGVDLERVLSSNAQRRARRMLREVFAPQERGPWRGWRLRRSDETFWRFMGSCYVPIEGEKQEAMKVMARQYLNRDFYQVRSGKPARLVRFQPSEKHVVELLENLTTDVFVNARQMPCWIRQEFDAEGKWIETPTDPLERIVQEEEREAHGLPHPWELTAFRNGLLDLREWVRGAVVLHPHTERYFSQTALKYDCPVELLREVADDDEALDSLILKLCPTWISFLESVTEGFEPDQQGEWQRLLAMFMGYTLTPWTKYQCMLLMVGASGSGKSTVLDWWQQLVGKENCVSARLGLLAKQFTFESYIGKMLYTFNDMDIGKADSVEAAEIVKMLTGEDDAYVDRKHKRALASVRFHGKPVAAANRMPNLPDPSGALATRFRVLPFVESFRDDGKGKSKQDPRYRDAETIRREAPGLMLWALRGLRWLEFEGRMPQPACGEPWMAEYRDYSDPTRRFVEECLELVEGSWEQCGEVYKRWCEWCTACGREPGNDGHFYKQLRTVLPKLKRTTRPMPEPGGWGEGERKGGYEGVRIVRGSDSRTQLPPA
jgi:P4 family phage/plasmid primase-like protien